MSTTAGTYTAICRLLTAEPYVFALVGPRAPSANLAAQLVILRHVALMQASIERLTAELGSEYVDNAVDELRKNDDGSYAPGHVPSDLARNLSTLDRCALEELAIAGGERVSAEPATAEVRKPAPAKVRQPITKSKPLSSWTVKDLRR